MSQQKLVLLLTIDQTLPDGPCLVTILVADADSDYYVLFSKSAKSNNIYHNESAIFGIIAYNESDI